MNQSTTRYTIKGSLVVLFAVLGFGFLTGAAAAQETPAPEAQAQQIGDNHVVVVQKTTAKSGDSVAGSQVVGVVGGSPTIQGQNSSTGATATSGNVTASNDLTVNAGPSATSSSSPPMNGVGTLASGTSGAQAQQIGDNHVVVIQKTHVSSGDCVAGSTVTGVVGSDAVIQNQNSSTGATCKSGDVTATNSLTVNAGPSVVVLLPPAPAPDPEADLSIEKEGVFNRALQRVIYTATVTNNGPDEAENVVFTDTLPMNTTFKEFTPPAGWTCSTPAVDTVGGTITCTKDAPMAPGETAVFDIRVRPLVGTESWTNEVGVESTTSDPDGTDNNATSTVNR